MMLFISFNDAFCYNLYSLGSKLTVLIFLKRVYHNVPDIT
jgi:hypothetical protein